MNWFNTIKVNVGKRALDKKIRHLKRQPTVCNINEARNIGIIYNATEYVSFEIIKDLTKRLTQNKAKVMVLGYVHSKKLIDHYLYRKGFDFFSKSNLNWYYKPDSSIIDHFINEPFDILINLSLEEYYPIQYITAVSPAAFKAGRYSAGDKYLDLMIDIEKEKQAMKNLHAEIVKDSHHENEMSDIEVDVEKKTETELQLSFLINHLMHYLSILKQN